MAKRPYTPALYEDIQATLDTVLAAGKSATLTLASPQRVTVWCQRANKFRVAMRQLDEREHGLAIGEGTSIYDQLIFRKQDNKVIIEFRIVEGQLEIDGQEVTPQVTEFHEFKTLEGDDK